MHHIGSWILADVLALVLAGFLIFSILLILAALFEKNRIRSLTAIPPEAAITLSPYARAMNAQVEQAGFTYLGMFGAAKGGMYKTVTTVWLSPDRTTRVTVIGGTIASIRTRRTLLTTRSHDGRKLVTTDEFGTRDLTGLTDREIVLNAHFPELWQAHANRIHQLPGLVPLFEPDGVLEQLADEAMTNATRLIDLGYARFTDSTQKAWCYTPKGAMKLWLQLLPTTNIIAQHEGRSRIKRPGS
jgi:hypothetical protein